MLDLNQIRRNILLSLEDKPTGHLGGSLGNVEMISVILENYIEYQKDWFQKTKNLNHDDQLELAIRLRNLRNKFILSGGHICPVLYAIWAELGLFNELIKSKKTDKISFLKTIRNIDSPLQGHPSLHDLPFLVDSSTGPLGQGAGVSLGYAYNDLTKQTGLKTFVTIGDGECEEGQIWESAMIASHLKLNNLIWVIDRNFIQIDGNTNDVSGLDNSLIISNTSSKLSSLGEKFSSFGWLVMENWHGNSRDSCKHSLEKTLQVQSENSLPAVIINYTTIGYPFKEFNSYHWHGKTPNQEQTQNALKQLT
jgi:transketolase